MPEKSGKILIIGGGIAGLCAGVYGLRCGYDVEILEMHDRPGGLATSWRRGDYTFETCLHWLLGSNPQRRFHRHWREVFDIDSLTFVHPKEYIRMESEGGETLIIHTDPDELEAELLAKAPEDEAEIRRFVAAVREFADFEMPEPPEDLRDWLGLVPGLRHLPSVRHWAGITVADYAQRFRHPLLRGFFAGGESDLSAIAIVLTLAWMGRHDADYPIGGSQAVIAPIAETFRALGGQLRPGARGDEILVEQDAAVGVRLADGAVVRGDWVISAADGHATIFGMLGGRYLDAKIREAYETFEPFTSYAQVSLGVARDLSGEPPFVTRVLEAPLQLDPSTRLEQVSFRIFNYDPSFAPVGRTAVTCFLPTRDHAYWTELRRTDPAAYEQEKARLAEAAIAVLERRMPGVRPAIEIVDVATPATIIRYTGNWRGSMEGWLITPKTGLGQLPVKLPGLSRFFMAGQWVAPGGGLPGGLMSARAAVQALCRQDHRPFAAREPLVAAAAPRAPALAAARPQPG